MLDVYRQVTDAAPRELSVALTMRLAPQADKVPAYLRGRPVIGILACHSGDASVADGLLAPFRKIPAQVDGITRKAYVDHQFVLGFPQPAGLHTYWKSEFLPGLTDGFFDAYKAVSAAPTSPLSQVILVQLGGAIADQPADATAMGNRDAEYIMLANGTWPPAIRTALATSVGSARPGRRYGTTPSAATTSTPTTRTKRRSGRSRPTEAATHAWPA